MKLSNIILEDNETHVLNRILAEVTEADKKAIEESEKSLVNESITSIVVGAIMAAPKLIEYLAKIVKFLVKIFRSLVKGREDETEGENAFSNYLMKKGHQLHDKYLLLVIKAVKLFGIAKSEWKDENGKIDEEKLKLTAKIILNIGIAIAGTMAIGGAISYAAKGNALYAAIEGSLGFTKADELLAAVKEIGPKIRV